MGQSNSRSDLYVIDEEFYSTAQTLYKACDDLASFATTLINILQFITQTNQGQYIQGLVKNVINPLTKELNAFNGAVKDLAKTCSSFVSQVDKADSVVY